MENTYLSENPYLVFSETFNSIFFLRDREEIVSVNGYPYLKTFNKNKYTFFPTNSSLLSNLNMSGNSFGISFDICNTGGPFFLLKCGNNFPITIFPESYDAIFSGKNGVVGFRSFNSFSEENTFFFNIKSGIGTECYLNENKLSPIIISGSNDGVIAQKTITNIGYGSKEFGLSNLIILNRPFSTGEIDSIYNDSWEFDTQSKGFWDFSLGKDLKNEKYSSFNTGIHFDIGRGSGYYAITGTDYYSGYTQSPFSYDTNTIIGWGYFGYFDSNYEHIILEKGAKTGLFLDFGAKNGDLYLKIYSGSSGIWLESSGANIETGRWINFAVNIDYSLNSSGVEFYVDGQNIPYTIKQNSYSMNGCPFIGNDTPIFFSYPMIGYLDELEIF